MGEFPQLSGPQLFYYVYCMPFWSTLVYLMTSRMFVVKNCLEDTHKNQLISCVFEICGLKLDKYCTSPYSTIFEDIIMDKT